jgi:hypothetical protein
MNAFVDFEAVIWWEEGDGGVDVFVVEDGFGY